MKTKKIPVEALCRCQKKIRQKENCGELLETMRGNFVDPTGKRTDAELTSVKK